MAHRAGGRNRSEKSDMFENRSSVNSSFQIVTHFLPFIWLMTEGYVKAKEAKVLTSYRPIFTAILELGHHRHAQQLVAWSSLVQVVAYCKLDHE